MTVYSSFSAFFVLSLLNKLDNPVLSFSLSRPSRKINSIIVQSRSPPARIIANQKDRPVPKRWSSRPTFHLSMSASTITGSDDPNADPGPSAVFTQSKEEVHSLLVDGGDVERGLSLEDLVGRWAALSELIKSEELFPYELDQIFRESAEVGSFGRGSNADAEEEEKRKLDKKGFYALYTSIDALFYIPDDENDDDADGGIPTADKSDEPNSDQTENGCINTNTSREDAADSDSIETSDVIKARLMSALNEMAIHAKNNQQLPCGLDCDENERNVIADLIVSLSSVTSPDAVNIVTNPKKKLTTTHAMGEWDLLYTCSRAMLINRSLSGLGRSTSAKAQFLGLRKRLSGSRFLGTAEYIETFGEGDSGPGGDGNEDDLSFEVFITGEWYFEEKRHAYTGLPAPCLRVELETVKYGPTTNGADQWSSLGPVKRTDFLYFDDDLMILRGNANPDALFVYQRITQ